MNQPSPRLVLAACAAALVLTACGGGGGGGGDDGGVDPNASEVPSSALQSVPGLIAYVEQVIADMTRNTREPIVLGNVTLPTSETLEPLP